MSGSEVAGFAMFSVLILVMIVALFIDVWLNLSIRAALIGLAGFIAAGTYMASAILLAAGVL